MGGKKSYCMLISNQIFAYQLMLEALQLSACHLHTSSSIHRVLCCPKLKRIDSLTSWNKNVCWPRHLSHFQLLQVLIAEKSHVP